MKTYAIGDIHGHLGLLQGVHNWIARDMAEYGAAPIVHLGDLVDRGPNSAGTSTRRRRNRGPSLCIAVFKFSRRRRARRRQSACVMPVKNCGGGRDRKRVGGGGGEGGVCPLICS